MSLGLILVIVLIVLLLGGFSGRFGGYGYGRRDVRVYEGRRYGGDRYDRYDRY